MNYNADPDYVALRLAETLDTDIAKLQKQTRNKDHALVKHAIEYVMLKNCRVPYTKIALALNTSTSGVRVGTGTFERLLRDNDVQAVGYFAELKKKLPVIADEVAERTGEAEIRGIIAKLRLIKGEVKPEPHGAFKRLNVKPEVQAWHKEVYEFPKMPLQLY